MIQKTNLKQAPSEVKQGDNPKSPIIRNNDIRTTIGELGQTLFGSKCQVENEKKTRKNQKQFVPKSMALEKPAVGT